MRRRTEITVETERIVVIRRAREQSVTVWCVECGAESLMLTVSEAAVLLEVSAMTIFRWAEAGHLHWVEMPDSALLICQNSLVRNRRTLLPPASFQEPDAA